MTVYYVLVIVGVKIISDWPALTTPSLLCVKIWTRKTCRGQPHHLRAVMVGQVGARPGHVTVPVLVKVLRMLGRSSGSSLPPIPHLGMSWCSARSALRTSHASPEASIRLQVLLNNSETIVELQFYDRLWHAKAPNQEQKSGHMITNVA